MSLPIQLPPLEYLRARFTLEDDGRLIWKKSGKLAGTVNNRKYRQVSVKGKLYQVHRIVFYLTHGWVPDELDHIDRDRTNNDPTNLRAATRSQTRANSETPSNKTEHRGIYLTKSLRYAARVWIKRKVIHLGCFRDINDAVAARSKAAKQYYGEFSVEGS